MDAKAAQPHPPIQVMLYIMFLQLAGGQYRDVEMSRAKSIAAKITRLTSQGAM